MRPVRIITDSTSDIPAALRDEHQITVVPLTVIFGAESFRDGVDLDSNAFYQRLREFDGSVKTSQPSVDAFTRAYEAVPAEYDIVSIHVSSKLSGTLNAARNAAEALGWGERIRLVDSLSVSVGLGAMVLEAATRATQGQSSTDIVEAVDWMRTHLHVYAMVDTLEYLRRGGRIGRVSSMLGSILSVKPILKVEGGELHPFERVRTRAKAIDRLVAVATATPRLRQVIVAGGDAEMEAGKLVERLRDALGGVRVIVTSIGPAVGVHAGPGVVGICLVEEP